MKISSIQGKIVIFIEKYIAWLLLITIKITLRFKVTGDPQKDKSVIYILWHQNIIPVALSRAYDNISLLASSSFDGELIAAPLQLLGYKMIRGSSSKKAVPALREMLAALKTNSIALTPDGPKGPAHKLKDGALFLAYMSKMPIVPLVVNVQRKWQFNSWDKFILPKPFSRVDIHYLPPIYIETKEEIQLKIVEIEESMEKHYLEF
ncbi:MAG TPA: lysophospholipid acyltransferase family protein [Candidatus Cloacimonadota bacterium]|nr:lysophospholipid acyltransferase family protein [Candidatus Cloacimonadota bacterium]HOQ80430.1 lysophospholipid acyltransferase family protein [Candidatus Cloacimonadota bacterium]